jgi:putative ABC transport system permease protein
VLWLIRHFLLGHVRSFPLRAAVQVLAIGVGVALGFAVHLINTSALAEFSAAVRQTGGTADAAIVGPREGFDDALFERVATDPAVVLANPQLAVDVVIAEPARLRGKTLNVVGVDALRAAGFGAQWIGAADGPASTARLAPLDDGLYLSPAARKTLDLAPGDSIVAQLAGRTQRLTVAGTLPAAPAGLAVAAMDIGFAQWRLDALGKLTRIELKLATPATTAADLRAAALRWQLPAGVFVEPADDAATRVSNLSRAYRVNLNVLALVALFTGSFLVYSLQTQSVLARRPQLAFLRMAGATQSQVLALLLIEAALVGAVGGVLGVAAGAGLAAGALRLLGGDLGGGYFAGSTPALALDTATAAGFALLGAAAAIAGGAKPALRAARDAPATALKSGSGLDAEVQSGAYGSLSAALFSLVSLRFSRRQAVASKPVFPEKHPVPHPLPLSRGGGGGISRSDSVVPPKRQTPASIWLRGVNNPHSPSATTLGIALLLIAIALLFAPSIDGIPLAAYASIALMLVAAIALKPALAPWVVRPLAVWVDARPTRQTSLGRAAWHTSSWLAVTRLAAAPRFASIGAAGIVASFALMVAMATMVSSFRGSVDAWLTRVLPADLYARAAFATGTSARFSERDVQAMRAHPGVARAEFLRSQRISVDPARAPVVLIMRELPPPAEVPSVLPLVGSVASAVARGDNAAPLVWISEAMALLYELAPGAGFDLPLAGRAVPVTVAGVWRDYARQSGAIVIDTKTFDALVPSSAAAPTDAAPTDAALWLVPGARAADVMRELRAQLDTRTAEFAEPGEIRALSLRIFDRSFAVTYVLELAAIAIGLTGIAATFSAQAIVRRREFGMLRHLGVTRTQILGLLALEGLLVTLLAIVVGLVAGLAIAGVLIAIVNPQSFHWTMEFRFPVLLVGGLIVALLAAAALTALIAGRRAVAGEAVLAVREDW